MTIAEELNLINSKENYNVKLVINGYDYNSVEAFLTIPEKEASKQDLMRCDYTREQLKKDAELLIKSRLCNLQN